MAPMDEISATAEPDTPPKNMQARMVTWAMAPGIRPTRTSASRTSRVETPPRARSVPAKMKKMTASSGNEFTAESMRWMMVEWSMSSVSPASRAPSPMPKEIGRLMIMKTKKQKNAIPSVMMSPLSREWVHPTARPNRDRPNTRSGFSTATPSRWEPSPTRTPPPPSRNPGSASRCPGRGRGASACRRRAWPDRARSW